MESWYRDINTTLGDRTVRHEANPRVDRQLVTIRKHVVTLVLGIGLHLRGELVEVPLSISRFAHNLQHSLANPSVPWCWSPLGVRQEVVFKGFIPFSDLTILPTNPCDPPASVVLLFRRASSALISGIKQPLAPLVMLPDNPILHVTTLTGQPSINALVIGPALITTQVVHILLHHLLLLDADLILYQMNLSHQDLRIQDLLHVLFLNLGHQDVICMLWAHGEGSLQTKSLLSCLRDDLPHPWLQPTVDLGVPDGSNELGQLTYRFSSSRLKYSGSSGGICSKASIWWPSISIIKLSNSIFSSKAAVSDVRMESIWSAFTSK